MGEEKNSGRTPGSDPVDTRFWQSAHTFEWVQPKVAGSFVLMSEGRELGTMAQPSRLRSVWHGESAFGRWEFRAAGMWSRRSEVSDLSSGHLRASYLMRWHAAEGILTLPDGPSFSWRQKSWIRGTCLFLDTNDRVVLEVRRGRLGGGRRFSDLFRTQGTISTNPGTLEPLTLGLLVFVAWFLIIVQNEETAAVAATTAAVG